MANSLTTRLLNRADSGCRSRFTYGGITSLSPELQREAARRLGLLCLVIVAIKVVMELVYTVALPQAFGAKTWLDHVLSPLVIVTSLGLFYMSRREKFSRALVVHLGYIYQVFTALCLGLLINRFQIAEQTWVPMWSSIAVWTLVFPIIVPGPTLRVVVSSSLSAAMDPISLCILGALGHQIPAASTMAARFVPNLLAVVSTVVFSKIIYHLGMEVTRAQSLGSYQLVDKLGQGGMGEVWLAKHRLLARPAAIKLIRPEVVGSSPSHETSTMRIRFEREAQATACLSSPNTVELYDFGTAADGTFFYVMELLDGLDLQSFVEKFGPLSAPRVVYMLRQACRSLQEAHSHGLIHRDIKPANLFACRYGGMHDFIKVLDFGLVKVHHPNHDGQQELSLTRNDAMAGTPAYLAPELAVDPHQVSPLVDLYALGCVAYWMLTGELVFGGKTGMEVIIKHVRSEPEAPSTRTSNPIPAELDQIILQCLAKDPASRPDSARQLERMLEQLPIASQWNEDAAAQWWGQNLPFKCKAQTPPEALFPQAESPNHIKLCAPQ